MSVKDNPISDKKHLRINRDVIIEPEMFYSEAFQTLSASALRTLIALSPEAENGNIGDSREPKPGRGCILTMVLFSPIRKRHFWGIGTTQFWKNMRTLVELGFH